jgi:hypothetical protein
MGSEGHFSCTASTLISSSSVCKSAAYCTDSQLMCTWEEMLTGGDGLFRQAAPMLAKCDAAILIPPVLPPFHRPASSGALTRMTACGSRHVGVIVSAPFLNGVWRARSARADGQVVAAIGRPLRGRTPIDTPLVKDILTAASGFAMALVFLEVSVVSGLTGWETLGVAVDETVVWTSRAARA